MQQADQEANLSPLDPNIRNEWTPMLNVHPSKSTGLYKSRVILLQESACHLCPRGAGMTSYDHFNLKPCVVSRKKTHIASHLFQNTEAVAQLYMLVAQPKLPMAAARPWVC